MDKPQPKAKLILNPAAGRGRAATLLRQIQDELSRLGLETDVAVTGRPGEASDIAQHAKQEGFELVIAAGGDGTLHEVVNGLVRYTEIAGGDVAGTLGVIPIGSGNDFVKMLQVPTGWRAACLKIVEGQVRRIDLGRVNDVISINHIGIGFDTQVLIEANKIKWARGFAIYALALASTMLRSYRTPQVRIDLDGEVWSQRITLLAIGNGRCAGGGFWITPEALIDDGWFDVGIARGLNKLQILALVPSVMRGTHIHKAAVRMARARKVVVSSDEPLPVQADGEILATDAHRVEAVLLPQKLAVIG